MVPSSWRRDNHAFWLLLLLLLLSTFAVLAHGSVEFFVDQEFDKCSRNGQSIGCLNNTDRGGLCAYAPDASMLWCCPAPDPCVLFQPLFVDFVFFFSSRQRRREADIIGSLCLFLVPAGDSRPVARGARRVLPVRVRFHVRMKAPVCI